MTWIRRSKGTVAGTLAGLLVLGGALAASAQAPKAERPSYAVGDKWIRSDGAYDLIRIENGRYVFAADGGREVHLSRDLGVAKIVRGGQVLLELEPPPGLTWPLEVGQSGVSWLTLKSLDPQFGQSVVRLTWKVDAYQDVRVPAGTFKAFRIVQVLEPRFLAASPQSRRLELAFWYAPAIQQLVRADGNDLSGLAFQAVALDRPAAAPLAVTLADPKDQGRVAAERITLTGKVTGGTGPLRIGVTLNGAEIARQEEPSAPGKDVPVSVPVKLAPGRNTLIVTATDGTGVSRQEGRVLFYDKPGPAVAAAPATRRPRRRRPRGPRRRPRARPRRPPSRQHLRLRPRHPRRPSPRWPPRRRPACPPPRPLRPQRPPHHRRQPPRHRSSRPHRPPRRRRLRPPRRPRPHRLSRAVRPPSRPARRLPRPPWPPPPRRPLPRPRRRSRPCRPRAPRSASRSRRPRTRRAWTRRR